MDRGDTPMNSVHESIQTLPIISLWDGYISALQRKLFRSLLNRAMKVGTVSRQTGCDVSTIRRLLQCIAETDSTVDRLRTGRSKVTAKRQDRQIRGRDCVRNGFNRGGKVSSSQTRARFAWMGQTGDGTCGEEKKKSSEIASSKSRIIEVEPASSSGRQRLLGRQGSPYTYVLTGFLAQTVSNRASLGHTTGSHLPPPPTFPEFPKTNCSRSRRMGEHSLVVIRLFATVCAEDSRNEWMQEVDTSDIDLANFIFDPLPLFESKLSFEIGLFLLNFWPTSLQMKDLQNHVKC
ncbi:hypothetical protein CAPTEDRAFT_212645 [Capitella teleta]|uniref:Uncharacterized protein n=1 Tax=Capitella teleta TaxID=283909 RepID=R7UYF4_CAPTE|nr:hypothetical protein CAPTEDRAFT_212645 [Capitella teleta]|eukprot:ELU11598.1 hypothetical protein CAPTEDRAFT_212645 [Capitella teleta]